MRLRTRLALSFSLLALLMIGLLVPLTLSELRQTLSREYESRLFRATDAAQSELSRLDDDVRRHLSALADSAALDEMLKALHDKASPATLAATAAPLMQSEQLSVLSLFDAQGRTLSSGHLPARAGDEDPNLFGLTHAAGALTWQGVEVPSPSGIIERPALLSARQVDYGEVRVWAVGGILLDANVADRLARLTGARVQVKFHGAVTSESGKVTPPLLTRSLAVAPDLSVELAFGTGALRATEQRLTLLGAVLGGLGLLVALGLGLVVARITTRPLEALAEGARRVSSGDWGQPVEVHADGEVGELISTFNAMTENLSRTTSRLVAAERLAAWQEMAKRLAHELKNPLTPIKMSLETLLAAHRERNPRFQGLFDESAGAMLEEVERLRRTVDAFSSFARVPKPQLAPLAVSEWASQVLQLHAGGRASIQLHTELTPGLNVNADRDQVTQVLVNLVKNALEAMPQGGSLSLRTRRVASEVVIELEDSGPGVPEKVRAQLFTPYFTTKQGGTGLGLALSQRICQEHGGRLEVDGGAGRGGVFRIVLPA